MLKDGVEPFTQPILRFSSLRLRKAQVVSGISHPAPLGGRANLQGVRGVTPSPWQQRMAVDPRLFARAAPLDPKPRRSTGDDTTLFKSHVAVSICSSKASALFEQCMQTVRRSKLRTPRLICHAKPVSPGEKYGAERTYSRTLHTYCNRPKHFLEGNYSAASSSSSAASSSSPSSLSSSS